MINPSQRQNSVWTSHQHFNGTLSDPGYAKLSAAVQFHEPFYVATPRGLIVYGWLFALTKG